MHSENEVVYLYLDDIIPNRFQPREVFDERALKELAVSIKEHGIIQPIIVRSIGQKYEIIAGERRYKASALAGLTKIPAIVRNLDDKESSKVALLENLQRKNLNPIEEARTYQKILELDQMTQEQLAKTMGKSQSAVANKLRLLVLTDEVQEALLKEKISERHARNLVNIKSPAEQKELLTKILENKMTVRELELEIKGEVASDDLHDDTPRVLSEKIDINTVSMPSALDDLIKIKHTPGINLEESKPAEPIDFSVKPAETKPQESTFDQKEDEPKFINYGEIDEDDLYDDKDEFKPREAPSSNNLDLDQLKANAVDINPTVKSDEVSREAAGGLDSLLNIAPQQPKEENKEEPSENRFFIPELKEKKEKPQQPSEKSLEDLFKTPDIIPVSGRESASDEKEYKKDTDELDKLLSNDLPMVSINEPVEKGSNNENKLDKALSSINQILKELKQDGYSVEYDEMELKNSYQMVIKILKDKN